MPANPVSARVVKFALIVICASIFTTLFWAIVIFVTESRYPVLSGARDFSVENGFPARIEPA